MTLDRNNASFKLKDEHYLDGTYIGTWTDNLYTDFPISAELKYEDGLLQGPFYYSGAFISCCQGQTDGRIVLELDSSTAIDSFTYFQTLASFMGGQCDGTYTGRGEIVKFSILEIDFEGADCEGPHTDGFIRLRK